MAQGALLIPQGPVSGFSYAGSMYQFTGSSQASDGNFVSQYQTSGANPHTATVEYSLTTNALVNMSINAPGGGIATYVDGATVGQPGAYVWSNTSTATNQLTSVNNNTFNPSGDSDLPNTAQTSNGVFQIKGNFMSLGTWSNNANQSGFDLSYYDGQTTSPSTIEFTSNRPSSTWTWDAATADGTAVNAIMQLDQTSRLLLYPAPDPNATSATGPVPTVTLDPNGTSEISGSLKVDGAIIVQPQGDLSMGTFTATPSPTP